MVLKCYLGLIYDENSNNLRHCVRKLVIWLVEIRVNDSESLDSALKRFNRKVQSDGILTDSRQNEYYEKPTEKRKKKEAAWKRKLRKVNSKTN